MRRTLATILFSMLLGSVAVTLAPPAHADDWDVKRDPFDPGVVARYKAILARDPHDAGALAKLLELYKRYRTVELLRSEYDKQLEKKPTDWATLVIVARLDHQGTDDPKSIEHFTAAVAAHADDAASWIELGQLQRQLAKPVEARADYDQALTHAGSKPLKMKALRALADLTLAAGDTPGASKYFEQYIALDPKNVQLRLEFGDALVSAKKFDGAIAAYQAADDMLGSDPAKRVEVMSRIGLALEGKGDDDGATAAYRKAIAASPKGYYLEVELTNRIIDIFRRKQALPSLLKLYEQQWSEASRGHFEWSTLGKLYEETGAQDKAIDALKKAVAKSPWELETQRHLIQLLEASGRDDEALKQYEIVVVAAPGEARFQLELAERYWRRGKQKEALAEVKHLESRFSGDAGILSAIADLYIRFGQEDLARAAFEKLVALEPNDPAHLVTLGEQYFQKGDKTKALAIWKRILEAGGKAKAAAAHAQLGEVLAEHNLTSEALGEYAQAIKLDPDKADFYKGRASVFESTKAYTDALADWEKVLALLPATQKSQRREAQRRFVQVLTRDGARETMYRNKWLMAFKATPPDADAGYFLVEYYGRRPQAGEPRATLERLRTIVPKDPDVLLALVKVYRGARLYDQAVALLLELINIDKSREREAYSQIAEIKTDAREDGEAIKYAKMALDKSPNDPGAFEHLAERYVEMQRFDDAIAAYVQVVRLDPRNIKAQFALAQLYAHTSQPNKAADLYRTILRTSTDEEAIGRAGREGIDLEESTETLGELEKVVAPLSFMLSYKPIYRRILVDLYLRYVPRLVERSRHGDPAVQAAARAELTRLGTHGLRPLLDALHDEKDVAQQRVAVAVLGHLGNRGAAAPLVRLALTEPPPDPKGGRHIGTLTESLAWAVRVDALIAAGRLGDPSVVTSVLPLAAHEEVAMREAAVFTLGRSGDKRAQPALLHALEDRRESVQALACLGLGQMTDGDVKVNLAMTTVLADGRRHDVVRAACAYGLGLRKSSSAATALRAAVQDNTEETQRLAAWALGQLHDPHSLDALWRAYTLRSRDDRDVIAWAITQCSSSTTAAMAAADLSEYPERSGGFDAAARIATLPGPIPAITVPDDAWTHHVADIADGLRGALSAHHDVVLSVLGDLDASDDDLSLSMLRGGVGSKPSAALLAARATLATAIAPAVTAQLSADDAEVRARALSVAAKVGVAGIDGYLVHGMNDPAAAVRQSALRSSAWWLQHATTAAAPARATVMTALLANVGAAAWQDRYAAVAALVPLAGTTAVSDAAFAELVKAAADRSSYVRAQLATTLGAWLGGPGDGNRTAISAVLTLSHDDVALVRAAAAAAMRSHPTSHEFAARLAELAHDDDNDVRTAAGATVPTT